MDKLDNGLICTPYTPTALQLADVLTKELSNLSIIIELGIDNIYLLTWGWVLRSVKYIKVG